jgi:hypothetical protein
MMFKKLKGVLFGDPRASAARKGDILPENRWELRGDASPAGRRRLWQRP